MMGDLPKLPRVGSAVVVVDDQGRVLLGIRGKEPNRGKWVLPGGGVRPFETLSAAATREIREETGLEVAVEGPVAIREIVRPPSEHRLIVFSSARVVGGHLIPGSDLESVSFFDPDELATLDVSDVVADVLGELGWLHPIAA